MVLRAMGDPLSGWLRFDDATAENPTLVPLSDRAFRLWFSACCYCHRNQTDGLVPVALAPSLSRTATKRTVTELLDAGKFEPRPGGFLYVHDYLEHNPSRASLAEMRGAAKERTAAWRERRHVQNGDASQTSHSRGRARPKSVSVSVEPASTSSENGFKVTRATVDQGALPASLPADLAPTAESVLGVLLGVQGERGGNLPTLRGVGLALVAFPDRDWMGVVRDLEHWTLAGTGQFRSIKDLVRLYRTFLERSPKGKPPTTRNGAALPNGSGPRRPNASDLLRAIDAQEAAS